MLTMKDKSQQQSLRPRWVEKGRTVDAGMPPRSFPTCTAPYLLPFVYRHTFTVLQRKKSGKNPYYLQADTFNCAFPVQTSSNSSGPSGRLRLRSRLECRNNAAITHCLQLNVRHVVVNCKERLITNVEERLRWGRMHADYK